MSQLRCFNSKFQEISYWKARVKFDSEEKDITRKCMFIIGII